MKLAEMTRPELEQVPRDVVVIVPFASCEQHSLHLPFFTDTLLLQAVVDRVEAARPATVLLLPTQWLGASYHHLPFPGTLTAALETHVNLIYETVDSVLHAGFTHVLVLNGHGGNIDTMQLALRQLREKHPDVIPVGASYWDVAAEELREIMERQSAVGHACELETSMMLALHPDLVRTEAMDDDGIYPTPAFRGVYLARLFHEMSRHGGYGAATAATAEKGERMIAAIVQRLVEVVDALRTEGVPTART